jgi:hypothetical protein
MSLRPSSQSSSSSSYRNDLNATASASNSPSTPNSSLLSTSSRSSSSRTPITDTRNQYKGYAFVFATDEDHEKGTVFGTEVGSSIRYIKPIHRSQSVGDLSPIGLPYFFTGFSWKDTSGLDRSVSALCLVRSSVWSGGLCTFATWGSWFGLTTADVSRDSMQRVASRL